MGYEVSGAFGVKLAGSKAKCMRCVGDGSFLMLHSELVTSLQEHEKIIVLLFDNHGFQCIHNLQRGHGSDGFGNEFRYRGADGLLSGEPLPIDFCGLAASLGCAAFFADDRTVAAASAGGSPRGGSLGARAHRGCSRYEHLRLRFLVARGQRGSIQRRAGAAGAQEERRHSPDRKALLGEGGSADGIGKAHSARHLRD